MYRERKGWDGGGGLITWTIQFRAQCKRRKAESDYAVNATESVCHSAGWWRFLWGGTVCRAAMFELYSFQLLFNPSVSVFKPNNHSKLVMTTIIIRFPRIWIPKDLHKHTRLYSVFIDVYSILRAPILYFNVNIWYVLFMYLYVYVYIIFSGSVSYVLH